MSAGERTLNTGSRPDLGSQAWMDALRSPGAECDQALARLHDLMLRVARREVARRSGSLRPGVPDPDGLAGRAAADALRAITADLGAIQGDSRFTTWAAKYAVAAVAAAAARAGARRDGATAQQAEDSGWDRLPGRLGLQPQQRGGWDEFAAALRRAVDEDLSDKQRRVFTAVTLDGVPAQVLAAGLGSSRNAIYKALFEARRRLRARLAADGHDPAHRSGNASACPRWAEAVLAADPGDAGCDFTFQLLDRYVEAELRGPGPEPRFLAVAAHLPGMRPQRRDRATLAGVHGGRCPDPPHSLLGPPGWRRASQVTLLPVTVSQRRSPVHGTAGYGDRGPADTQALGQLRGDRHELVTNPGRPRHQRHLPVAGRRIRISDPCGAAGHRDRPAGAGHGVQLVRLERHDRVIHLAGHGRADGGAQQDQPVHDGEVHRPHRRQRVHGEDQPPDRHGGQQPQRLAPVQPGELAPRARMPAIIHRRMLRPPGPPVPGPKVPTGHRAQSPANPMLTVATPGTHACRRALRRSDPPAHAAVFWSRQPGSSPHPAGRPG